MDSDEIQESVEVCSADDKSAIIEEAEAPSLCITVAETVGVKAQ